MIFSKKIYKLVSGKNLTLYSEGSNTFSVFIFNKGVNKYLVNLYPEYKSTLETENLAYNQITKLNESHSLVCYDKNLSIIENEKQNI